MKKKRTYKSVDVEQVDLNFPPPHGRVAYAAS